VSHPTSLPRRPIPFTFILTSDTSCPTTVLPATRGDQSYPTNGGGASTPSERSRRPWGRVRRPDYELDLSKPRLDPKSGGLHPPIGQLHDISTSSSSCTTYGNHCDDQGRAPACTVLSWRLPPHQAHRGSRPKRDYRRVLRVLYAVCVVNQRRGAQWHVDALVMIPATENETLTQTRSRCRSSMISSRQRQRLRSADMGWPDP
jgi:hypothetical protein